jgi:hypothetical protein
VPRRVHRDDRLGGLDELRGRALHEDARAGEEVVVALGDLDEVVTAQNPWSSGSSSSDSSIGGCQVIVPRSRRRANVFSRSSPVVDQKALEEMSSSS